MESGRLEAFSDGVFAVAITLLALNLAVPGPGHGPLGQQLAGHWPAFAAYVVSFLTIGIIWVNHHAVVGNFSEVDRPLLFLNLLLLFFVISIPFATETIADYLKRGGPDASLAAAIYQGVFLGMPLSFGALFWWSIRRSHLKVPLSGAGARAALVRFTSGSIVYGAAIGIAYLSAPASLLERTCVVAGQCATGGVLHVRADPGAAVITRVTRSRIGRGVDGCGRGAGGIVVDLPPFTAAASRLAGEEHSV